MKRLILIPLVYYLFQGCCPTCIRSTQYSLNQTDICPTVQNAFMTPSFYEGDFTPCSNWWDFFQDPQLKEFIEISLSCHPDIAIADSRVRRACFQSAEARSRLYPHIYLFADVQRERLSELSSPVPGVFGNFTKGEFKITSASFELDLWKKKRAIYSASLDEVALQKADFEEAKLILSTAIAAVYFDLQLNLQRIAINKERLKARKELYGLLREQFSNAVISQFRLYETDTQVEAIQDFILRIESRVEEDKHALQALVGNLGCACIDIEPRELKPFYDFPLPCSLPFDFLARRPDVKAHLWKIQEEKFFVHVAKTRFYPKIDLMAFAGFLSYYSISNLFTNKAIETLAEATGLLPLFTAGKLKAELGVALENTEIAIQQYNRTILEAVQEVSDALSNLIYADKRLISVKKSLQDTQNLYQLTYDRFQHAIGNRIALLNAEESLLIQKDLEVEIQLRRYESAVDLIRAIGGGYYDASYCPG